MSVWMVMPSAAPIPQARICVSAWKARGYSVAIACEDGREIGADFTIRQHEYPGYASSVNRLIHNVLANDPECVAVVAAADDLFPDPKRTAGEIAADLHARHGDLYVVQGTGDRWALEPDKPPQSERVAGSPWMSRAWCLLANEGQGPLWPEYVHCWADNELMEVATWLGVFWQDVSICHRHEHFLRRGSSSPPHAAKAYAAYAADQATFERRKAAGFPGSELLPES